MIIRLFALFIVTAAVVAVFVYVYQADREKAYAVLLLGGMFLVAPTLYTLLEDDE